MGREPVTNQDLAMSQGSAEPGSEKAGSEGLPTAGGAFTVQSACGQERASAGSAFFTGDGEADHAAIDQDDDVTVVVTRGFPRLSYSRQRILLRALTIVGIVAVGFTVTGIARLAMVRHRASSQIQGFAIAAPPVTSTNQPAGELPAGSPVSTAPAAEPGTAKPASVASRGEDSTGDAVAAPQLGDGEAVKDVKQVSLAGKADLAMCQAALAKRDRTGIAQACEHALEVDASLAVPILAWAKRELDCGNVSVAVTWARRVLETDDHLADAYLIVGVAEQEAGRASGAKAAYRRYLEFAPTGRYVRDVRLSIAAL